jgi:cobalamin biosynthesis protein CobD/CbiB
METETTVLISGVVAGVVQMGKLGGVGKGGSLIFALVVSIAAVLLWGVSHETHFERIMIWQYFTGVVAVAGTAIGIHSAAKNTTEIVREKQAEAVDPFPYRDQ